MALQETDHKLTVAEAKARLLAIGEQARAERAAKGPLGTMKGKAVVGGAVAALVVGLLMARPLLHRQDEPRPRRRREREWSPRFDRLRESFTHWRDEPEKARNVKKAAVGGLSLGLVMQLAKPLLPHLAQLAAAKYAQYRAAKAEAAQAVAQEEVAKARAAQANVQRQRAEDELG